LSHRFIERALHGRFAFGVEVRRRLIEDHEVGGLEQ
jgi:hypothetical protein